jgi:hypothetical protein
MTFAEAGARVAAREFVLAIAQTGFAVIEVTGSDRVSWLNGLVTCDVMKCDARSATRGLVLQRTGRILSDTIVVVDEAGQRLLAMVPETLADMLVTHFEHYLVMEDVEIRLHREDLFAWALHGPRSGEACERCRGDDACGGSCDVTGLGGALLLAMGGKAEGWYRDVKRHVIELGGVVGEIADWESLRIERGVARMGVDFGDSTYPQEASLETSAVSFDKGCYLGQEVVCMLERRGRVQRKLVAIRCDLSPPPPPGTSVLDPAGAKSGEVTSSAWIEDQGKSVAIAMVKRASSEPGTQLVVMGAPAEVIARPM